MRGFFASLRMTSRRGMQDKQKRDAGQAEEGCRTSRRGMQDKQKRDAGQAEEGCRISKNHAASCEIPCGFLRNRGGKRTSDKSTDIPSGAKARLICAACDVAKATFFQIEGLSRLSNRRVIQTFKLETYPEGASVCAPPVGLGWRWPGWRGRSTRRRGTGRCGRGWGIWRAGAG